ncbi:hypothetical protein PVAP13_6NG194803 [Panicum virgatum]|uniref:Uncharacterized protein n=1 Tax=Panicum virgatum TaxID=38727 RepID=A0A8T0QWS1_PANVG|nr:hypothetical protein PVAP13_6NG194803 [Panicum virgatum]
MPPASCSRCSSPSPTGPSSTATCSSGLTPPMPSATRACRSAPPAREQGVRRSPGRTSNWSFKDEQQDGDMWCSRQL